MATYLGTAFSDSARANTDISQRRQKCHVTLKRLHPFLRNSNCTVAFKLQVATAILHSQALYGLESAALTQKLLDKLDTFHLKVLRQILHLDTTFIDRSNTNQHVYRQASTALLQDKLAKWNSVRAFLTQAPRNHPNKNACPPNQHSPLRCPSPKYTNKEGTHGTPTSQTSPQTTQGTPSPSTPTNH